MLCENIGITLQRGFAIIYGSFPCVFLFMWIPKVREATNGQFREQRRT